MPELLVLVFPPLLKGSRGLHNCCAVLSVRRAECPAQAGERRAPQAAEEEWGLLWLLAALAASSAPAPGARLGKLSHLALL